MAHYATLDEYRFEDDVKDIRGAKLYGEGAQELGQIRDVVFDHSTGDIRYLVAEYGHGRLVLVPMNHLFRSVLDEDSFSSDLTQDDLDRLPAFDRKLLTSDRQWRDYERLYRTSLDERNKAAEQEFKREWTGGEVQHMDDDVAHNITPVEQTPAPGSAPERGDDYVPDVWPKRMAPVFGPTENTSEKLNMVPQAGHSRGRAAEYTTAGFGPKWNGFAEIVRRDLHKIRGQCERCREIDTRAA